MSIKLPVSYKEFLKHPLMAVMYLLICGIVGMYVDQKIDNSNQRKEYRQQIKDCKTEAYMLNMKVDIWVEKVRKSDSLMNRLASKLETLKELGKIQ